MNLIRWLSEKQATLDVSDAKFASLLGISDSFWNLLKNGKRRPTLMILRSAVDAFPADRETILSCALVLTTVSAPVPTVSDAIAS